MTLTLQIPTLNEQLTKTIHKIEALESDKQELAAALREAFQEAKQEGLDVKALREILKLRKADNAGSFDEHRSTMHRYMQALGMV